MGERYYVYAIALPDIRLPEGVSGFGSPLHILSCGELGAVVSRIHAAEADSITSAASADHLLRHETVVEAIRAGGPALPVRFGTVLPDGEAVTRALATQYETLRNDLRRIGDKIELGVTALWHPTGESSGASMPKLEPDQHGGADVVAETRRPGSAYLRARQTELQKAELARARAQTLARELDAALGPLALECHQSVCPSERLALRNLYLLERERIDAFERALAEVRQRHREVQFLLSGPWPPYSFVAPPARNDTDVPLFT